MSKNKFNNDIYDMYEVECNKNRILEKENKTLKLDNSNLRYELDYLKKSSDNKIKKAVDEATCSLNKKINKLETKLSDALIEIARLKAQNNNDDNNDDNDNDKNYTIDKLTNQLNKDSSNSGIPTSKEIKKSKNKTRTNMYNHRGKTSKKNGGQLGHKGNTLTKEKLINKIKDNNIKVNSFIHYIKGNENKEDVTKYKIGMKVELYVEEHIFKHTQNTQEVLPKEYYSDVTYTNDLKALVVTLGNYYSLPYGKVKEILYDFSNGIIDISEGTIDNVYEEFSNKCEDTINNITNNILNGKYQHTDETTTKENGKDTYYRGYANKQNVLYKYHHRKGDKPIKEDNILTNFFGTIVSDHEVGIFKYGLNNQDCVIHTGRYCIEAKQNVYETWWQMELYHFLLKLERQRKILIKFGKNSFTDDEIKKIEDEYDNILKTAKEQNENILSTYWKEKETTLLNRLIKYKNSNLLFIHDFELPYENNLMERLLRMIKGKTKVSGGFRSTKGGERFGNIMSVIKTAKLRKLNPLNCIKEIYQGNVLFA